MIQMNPLMKSLSSEVWAIDPKYLQRLFADISVLSLDDYAEAFAAAGKMSLTQNNDLNITDGIAHISIDGPILKNIPAILKYFGIRAASTDEIKTQIKAALENESVKAIVLDIDSPGGTVNGVADLADDIAQAKAKKPIHTSASDQMASAAYWIGAQASTVSANQSASVGSIGVFTVVHDESEGFAADGIKTYVISNNELKGIGVPGSKLTDAQHAELQREVNDYTNLFKTAIMRGRNFSKEQIDTIATGATWLGGDAKRLGLIDHIQNSQQVHSALVAKNNQAPTIGASIKSKKEINMDKELQEKADKMAQELADLKAKMEKVIQDKAKSDAELSATREVLKSTKEAQKKEMIEKYSNKIAPSCKASIEVFAEKCGDDLNTLKVFLEGLPTVVRNERVSFSETTQSTSSDLTSEQEKELKDFGVSLFDVKRYRNVQAFDPLTRTWIMKDGSETKELK